MFLVFFFVSPQEPGRAGTHFLLESTSHLKRSFNFFGSDIILTFWDALSENRGVISGSSSVWAQWGLESGYLRVFECKIRNLGGFRGFWKLLRCFREKLCFFIFVAFLKPDHVVRSFLPIFLPIFAHLPIFWLILVNFQKFWGVSKLNFFNFLFLQN